MCNFSQQLVSLEILKNMNCSRGASAKKMVEEEGESLLSWLVWYAHAAAWTSGVALLSFCLTATVVFAVLKIIARRVRQANAKSGELTVSAVL
jgi:hypothetical protein